MDTRRPIPRPLLLLFVSAGLLQAQTGLEPGRQEQVLFNGQIQVPPGRQWIYSFSTLTNFVNGRIAGSVQASGGSGNDIRVLVTRGQSVIYDSGQRRSVVLSVDISEPGQYSLIFDNGFSVLAQKAVGGRISLVHWGIDAQKNVADQQLMAERNRQGTEIIQRLYAAFKTNERSWGTTQLFAVPTLRISDDRSINAGANWSSNLIQINRGTFEFAEKNGEQGVDILAAIVAHELGHIFYRHPGYGSGSGVTGFFDELRGVTELDRIQEKEADILGLRVACQANYDPDGMLLVMRKFAELDSGASSFMRNHPSGIERYNYLQGEVAQCRAFQSGRNSVAPRDTTLAQSGAEDVAISAEPQSPQELWKLVQSPNFHWRFKMGEGYMYGERVLPDEQQKLGDYDTVDVKKQGDDFRGTQRVRVTFKVTDSSPQGFHYKACQWEFAVEISSVSSDRIEGRWEGYPSGSKVNVNSCSRSGQRIWESADWIKE